MTYVEIYSNARLEMFNRVCLGMEKDFLVTFKNTKGQNDASTSQPNKPKVNIQYLLELLSTVCDTQTTTTSYRHNLQINNNTQHHDR